MDSILTKEDSCENVSMCAYADFELNCPFCECSYLSIGNGNEGTEYKCSNCGGGWTVLGK